MTLNWKKFAVKSAGRERNDFEQLSYHLFCREHDITKGLFRYKNQAGIETDPVSRDGDIVGFQAKYYESSIDGNVTDINDSIEKAKGKNPTLTVVQLYLNQEFSESSKKDEKEPKYKRDIESHAKSLGLSIEWVGQSHFEIQLARPENQHLFEHYFLLEGESKLCSSIAALDARSNSVIKSISTDIEGVHIERTCALENLRAHVDERKTVLVSGARGSGKSSLIKSFVEGIDSRDAAVFCLRADDLNKAHLAEALSALGVCVSHASLWDALDSMPNKYLIIESAEKILELEHKEAVKELLGVISGREGWRILLSCRDYAVQGVLFECVFGKNCHVIHVENFSDTELEDLLTQVPMLSKMAGTPEMKKLLKNPFYSKLACMGISQGAIFNETDGEQAFRKKIWTHVIATTDRHSGISLARGRVFVELAVKRAKLMSYGVSLSSYDITASEALLKLEADGLVRINTDNNLVYPAHDVLEDWALDRHIDDIYRSNNADIPTFLDGVGHQPAMARAYRLWLHQKIAFGEDIGDLTTYVLIQNKIGSVWRDETIAAILHSDDPALFLTSLSSHLWIDDAALLKRFLSILRLSCTTPVPMPELDEATCVFRPQGRAWPILFKFLCDNNALIPEDLTPLIDAIFKDWSSWILRQDTPLPEGAREAGLLALAMLGKMDDSHETEILKTLWGVAIKTSSVMPEEFTRSVEQHRAWRDERGNKSYAFRQFLDLAFATIETRFLCKNFPDLLIELGLQKWLVPERPQNIGPFDDYGGHTDMAGYFGLRRQSEFFPASGSKGPFEFLLAYHPCKGLDFILDLLNKATNAYEKSTLDNDSKRPGIIPDEIRSVKAKVNLHLNDGATVDQLCSYRLWNAYRGSSVMPELLECALMALENWMVVRMEVNTQDEVDWLFGHILKSSNSVMATSILASIAVGFHEKVGRTAMPLLGDAVLYELDMRRMLKESESGMLNFHGGILNRDPLSDVYTRERKKSHLRPWRKKHLEDLAFCLQFTEARDDVWTAIDRIRSQNPLAENIRFLLQRIDSRGVVPVADPKNQCIRFVSKDVPSDLQAKQEETQAEHAVHTRFSALWVWAKKTFAREVVEHSRYASWRDALAESKALMNILMENKEDAQRLGVHFSGGVVTAAALFIRDHAQELEEDDVHWCLELAIEMALRNWNTHDHIRSADATDHDGAAAAAAILGFLFDYCENDEDRAGVEKIITISLMHANEHVRHAAASGVREYVWSRNPEFASKCVAGSLAYAKFEAEQRKKLWQAQSSRRSDAERLYGDMEKSKDEFITQFVAGFDLPKFGEINLSSYSAWHMLAPCLMIPEGSNKKEHVEFLSRIIDVFYALESSSRRDQDDGIEHFKYSAQSAFSTLFAGHLGALEGTGFEPFKSNLIRGCEVAPDFVHSVLLSVAVRGEKNGIRDTYWSLCNVLLDSIKQAAHRPARRRSNHERLVRGIMLLDIPFKGRQEEESEILLGKKLILSMAKDAGQNVDVFEGATKLISLFPKILHADGFHLLAKHQKDAGNLNLMSGTNTVFYLERSIKRFLQVDQHGSLKKKDYDACLVLLDAMVEMGSPSGYYLRDQLLRTRCREN